MEIHEENSWYGYKRWGSLYESQAQEKDQIKGHSQGTGPLALPRGLGQNTKAPKAWSRFPGLVPTQGTETTVRMKMGHETLYL